MGHDLRLVGCLRVGLVLVLASSLATSSARAVDVLVSGQSIAAVIDVDGDGPDADDCTLSIVFNAPNYEIVKQQVPATIRMCTGTSLAELLYTGQDSSSDYAGLEYTGSGQTATGGGPSFPALTGFVTAPHVVEILDESEVAPPDGLPIEVNQIEWEKPIDNEVARAELCDAGDGPVVRLEVIANLLGIEIPFVAFPSQAAPTHFVLDGLPFERTPPDEGTSVNGDVYLPVTAGGAYTVANADTPNELLINVEFDALPACSTLIGVTPAIPTLGTVGLVVLSSALLLLALALLRRRLQARARGAS